VIPSRQKTWGAVCVTTAVALALTSGLINRSPIPPERRYLFPRGKYESYFGGQALGPILPKQPTSFIVKPEHPGFYGIELPFVTYARINYSNLIFSLYYLPPGVNWPLDRDQAVLVARENIAANYLLDWTKKRVFFPVQPYPVGSRYAVELSTSKANLKRCVSLAGKRDSGTYFLGNRPRTGRVEAAYTLHANPPLNRRLGFATLVVALGLFGLGLWFFWSRRWAEIIRPAFETSAGPAGVRRVNPWLIAVFVSINGLILANALLHHFEVGFDVPMHLRYAMILAVRHRLPVPAETFEFFSPPLAYLLPALFFKLVPSAELTGKLGQLVNFGYGLGLSLVVLKLAELIRPGQARMKMLSLGLLATMAVLYKTYAMTSRGEPLLAFLVALSIYWAARCLVAGGRTPKRDWIWLGVFLGLAVEARQWGFFVFPALGLAVAPSLLSRGRLAAAERLALALAVSFTVGGFFYFHLLHEYGRATAFNQPRAPEFALSNQPESFYLGVCRKHIFRDPVANYCSNQSLPILLSETFGDYWGEFLFIKAHRHLDYDWAGAAAAQANPPLYLGRANAFGLAFVSVFLAGLLLGLVRLPAQLKSLARSPSARSAALAVIFLTAVFTLLGYSWFLIQYPSDRGNTIKATYMFQFFPLAALLGAEALMTLAQRARWLQRLSLGLLAIAALHNLPTLLTRYCLWFY